ncbi:MAG: DEAD/DEAH box helicase family protein [Oscillospiraceae bacterium]
MAFENVRNKRTLRTHQQKIIDKSVEYLRDRKLHIVAAPGSGKTVLGLECIVRMRKPALVLSPGCTIRNQWLNEFVSSFEANGEDLSSQVSSDLYNMKPLTSITYQMLTCAFKKEEYASEDDEANERVSFENFNLLEALKQSGVGVICLDEAHHLKREWQRAISSILEEMKKDREITVISLTATPPYDSADSEWDNYESLCGKIDIEISVPELVARGYLCPHQDFVYFSRLTDSEQEEYEAKLREKIDAAYGLAQKVGESSDFQEIAAYYLNKIQKSTKEAELWQEEIAPFLSLADNFGVSTGALLSAGSKIPEYCVATAEKGFEFLLNKENPFYSADMAEELKKALGRAYIAKSGRVCFIPESESGTMTFSLGKLESINAIISAESDSLKEKLRALILTDRVGADDVPLIETDTPITKISAVSVFESVRRMKNPSLRLAVLTGSVVIIPSDLIGEIDESLRFSTDELGGTGYSRVNTTASMVPCVGKMLAEGKINTLVGTRSLLGEGWDAPSVNTLIMASFIATFVQSNQMRGRAIRVDKNAPDKCSNIWHLVTVDEISEKDGVKSSDLEILKKRFNCFLAPSFTKDTIENKIDRLGFREAELKSSGTEEINKRMISASMKRGEMLSRWKSALNNAYDKENYSVFYSCRVYYDSVKMSGRKAEKYIRKIAEGILSAMKKSGDAKSARAAVKTGQDSYLKDFVSCTLINASQYEKKLFADSVCEFFSSIDKPRYVLVRKTFFKSANYAYSYSCPKLFMKNEKTVTLLTEEIRRRGVKFAPHFVYSTAGRSVLKECRKRAFQNKASKAAEIVQTINI